MTTLDLTDSATRAQFPALARIYDTIHAAFVTAGSPALAAACVDPINAITMGATTRSAVLTLCLKYGERQGGSELATTIINDVLYQSWETLQATYNLPALPAGEGPAELTWGARVMLLELIAESAREIVLEDVCDSLAVLSNADTSAVEASVRALTVSDWGTVPTTADVEAWQAS